MSVKLLCIIAILGLAMSLTKCHPVPTGSRDIIADLRDAAFNVKINSKYLQDDIPDLTTDKDDISNQSFKERLLAVQKVARAPALMPVAQKRFAE